MAWMKVLEIQPILDNIWQFFQVILTIFTLNISGFSLELSVSDVTIWSVTYGQQLHAVNYAPRFIQNAPREHL